MVHFSFSLRSETQQNGNKTKEDNRKQKSLLLFRLETKPEYFRQKVSYFSDRSKMGKDEVKIKLLKNNKGEKYTLFCLLSGEA